MPFDETQYKQDFINKLRRANVLPDDLLARYAITLPASDAEIAAQVKAVRGYWNKTYQGQASGAKVAKLCRSADERLKNLHGAAMETRAWWEKRQSELRSAAQEQIKILASLLEQSYRKLGVVTNGIVAPMAAKLDLTVAESVQAVEQAGLRMVEGISLPESAPIQNFSALRDSMSECAASSVPELVHPGAGQFSLVERYVCIGDPGKRLDVAAVNRQVAEAEKRGASKNDDALRSALRILVHALKNDVDLRDIALYHLVTIAQNKIGLSPELAAKDLQKTGLTQDDAAVIAVVLAEQNSAVQVAGLDKVRSLLAEGGLAEATQAAQALSGAAHREEALAAVSEARKRLDALLAEATAAREIPDDARAVAVLRKAADISFQDAAEALATIPLAPPTELRAVCEGSAVRLFWQRAPGHEDGTTYVVSRTEQRSPAAAGDGTVVHRDQATTCSDAQAPAARVVQYGVFAVSEGRPSSRPAVVPVTLLPPVTQLAAEVEPDTIALHWLAHPAACDVRVTKTTAGAPPAPVTVTGSGCQLDGLAEGQSHHFEVIAIYRGSDGAELRSAAEHLDATPKAEAQPIPKLRARPIEVSGAVRIRVAWTPVDSSEVQIRRSATPPGWKFGAWVSPQEMAQFGQEVTGRRVLGRAEVALEVEVPAGVHHLVPFSIGGSGIVVGAPVAVGVTAPVNHLVVTPFATYATVSWEWPPGAQLAEVSWEIGDDADSNIVGLAQYRSDGGVRVPLGQAPCTVEVRALIMAGEVTFTAPPARAVIEKVVDIAIAYTISGVPAVGRLGGRSKKLVFKSDEGCQNVQVRLVASPGRVMPTSATAGIPLLETTLALEPGIPAEHHVTVPKSVKRPYWVRCFIVAGRARLIDPPISALKET